MAVSTMKDKVVLITGATNGIGKVAALELARQGASVVIVGRNPEKTTAVVDEIKRSTGNTHVESLIADLSSIAEVRRLADAFKQKYSRLDILINNAGATFTTRQETVDGLEMTFATNHLSYFLLTTLLLDVLKASAPARVVNVASDAHTMGKIDFDDLQNHKNFGFQGFRAYSNSKLANVLFTYELARRLEGTGVTANVLHPGFVASGFGMNNAGLFRGVLKVLQSMAAITPEQGAETILYLATSPDVEGVTGKYWDKRKAITSSTVSYNVQTAQRLWDVSEQLTAVKQPV
jgi:retinol dehydrogenase-12